MRWLPSTRMRYFWLGVAVLAIVGILDALEKSLAGQGVVGRLVVVLACFAVVYGWFLVEPLIDEALVSAKTRTSVGAGGDQVQLERILAEVARNAGMHVPRILRCVVMRRTARPWRNRRPERRGLPSRSASARP